MDRERYLVISGSIFGMIALLHLVQMLGGLTLTIGVWTVPVWLSLVALIVSALLSYRGITLWRKNGFRSFR